MSPPDSGSGMGWLLIDDISTIDLLTDCFDTDLDSFSLASGPLFPQVQHQLPFDQVTTRARVPSL